MNRLFDSGLGFLTVSKGKAAPGDQQQKSVDTHAGIAGAVSGGRNRAGITADLKEIDLPVIKQTEDWSCGAALVASVCRHFGIEPNTEAEAIRMLGSSPTDGTGPDAISEVLEAHGLVVDSSDWRTLRQLKEATQAGSPVLTPIQMYGFPQEYEDAESGHWVAVTGIEGETIKIHDPVSGAIEMDQCEFVDRWFDKSADGTPYERFGMIVSKGEPKATEKLPQNVNDIPPKKGIKYPTIKSILGT